MWYLLDLSIILIIVLITFISYKKGIIKVAFKVVSFVLAIIIALVLYKPISNYIINNTTFYQTIEDSVEKRLSSEEITKEETNNILENYYIKAKTSTVNVLSEKIATGIISISVGLIVFLVSRLILGIFKLSGDLIAKIPGIKQVNQFAGFVYGIIKSFIIIYGILAIISLLAPIFDLSKVITLINSSIIANIMYNHNLIFMIFI